MINLQDKVSPSQGFVNSIDQIKGIIENALKNMKKILQDGAIFKEELNLLKGSCQINIIDLDFSFWIEFSDITFNFKYSNKNKKDVKLKVYVKSEHIFDIFRDLVKAKEYYAKGHIVLEGSLRYALHFIKFMQDLYQLTKKA
ncbi:MAG: SCP2 sterol-binding domain-containing protein [Promethearchaeota archaeon]